MYFLIYVLVYKLGDVVGVWLVWFVRYVLWATYAALSGTYDVGCYCLVL